MLSLSKTSSARSYIISIIRTSKNTFLVL